MNTFDNASVSTGIPSAESLRANVHERCCLREMPAGVRTRVRELRGCGRSRSHLCALGFTPGTEITVYGRGANGCRVRVRDTCVVLDCDSAENILCDTGLEEDSIRAVCEKSSPL